MCGNIACAVRTLDDEKDIPEIWRAKELSKLEGPKAQHPGKQLQRERGDQRPLQGTLGEDVGESCVVEYDDECDERDYCIPEDESASAKGDYVSLVDNPERFTGYTGESAHMVWDAIYKENCFSLPSLPSPPSNPLFSNKPQVFPAQAANDLRSVLQANAPPTAFSPDDTCLEKRVFHRVISGMHASISTHICHDYLNQTTGNWGPNLQCYQDRLASHPDRISNLYFNYALVLRAVAKLRNYFQDYTFCSGDPRQDAKTKTKVIGLADQIKNGPIIFDETLMFQDPAVAGDLKEDFRQRFRNVSRLMDCVGCDKCRLWGKLQTVGYGTALKVLFEYDENAAQDENPALKRTELVALVNTLDRISHSLSALEKFRAMTASQVEGKSAEATAQLPDAFSSPSSSSSLSSSFDDDSDDFEDDFEDNNSTVYDEETVSQAFASEFNLIFRTLIYVLKSWLSMPKKMLYITIFELSRIWAFWLGLEVPVREWGFRVPSRDEL